MITPPPDVLTLEWSALVARCIAKLPTMPVDIQDHYLARHEGRLGDPGTPEDPATKRLIAALAEAIRASRAVHTKETP